MSDENSALLSAAQRRLIAFALTLGALLLSAAVLIGTLVAVGRLAGFFSGVLWPLATAGVFALILRPLVDVLVVRLRFRRIYAVILLYGIFLLVVFGMLVLVVPPLIDQVISFVLYLPSLWESIAEFSRTHYPRWVELAKQQMENPTIRRILESLGEEASAFLSHAIPSLKAAGGGVVGVFTFIAHLAIVPVYLFFFLLSSRYPIRRLRDHLPFFSEGVRDDITFLVREFVVIIESFFRGQLIIGFIMGVLYAIGFSFVGLRFGLFLGLAAGMLNIVPYLGTIIGLVMTLPLAFLQQDGGWPLVGLVLLVIAIVQTIEGWILTPKIMGDRTGLHPVMIIVAVFFWGTAFHGILGMLLAIPLTAFFVTAWRLAQRKYFTAVVPASEGA